MTLIAYSDSEGSDAEEETQTSAKPTSKPNFQKVVDSSNPRKILVNLPTTVDDPTEPSSKGSERPAKRPRTGGAGIFGGLSSFLPAPKRSGEAAATVSASPLTEPTISKSSSSAVNLRTGSTPAFSRSSISSNNDVHTESQAKAPVIATTVDADDVKLVGKVTMFRPLSVAQNRQKKKKPVSAAKVMPSVPTQPSVETVSAVEEPEKPKPKPKTSLFSFASEEETVTKEPVPSSEPLAETVAIQESYQNIYQPQQTQVTAQQPQTLDSIASDLQLDEATRRRLFGRKGKGDEMPVELLNFNADNEYAANEEIRASGETIQHNPLRGVQPGRHSLRQLVNSAATQKEALEEAWATGKRNKKEAGSRYGW